MYIYRRMFRVFVVFRRGGVTKKWRSLENILFTCVSPSLALYVCFVTNSRSFRKSSTGNSCLGSPILWPKLVHQCQIMCDYQSFQYIVSTMLNRSGRACRKSDAPSGGVCSYLSVLWLVGHGAISQRIIIIPSRPPNIHWLIYQCRDTRVLYYLNWNILSLMDEYFRFYRA